MPDVPSYLTIGVYSAILFADRRRERMWNLMGAVSVGDAVSDEGAGS